MFIHRWHLPIRLALGVVLALGAWGLALSFAEAESPQLEGSWRGTLDPAPESFPSFPVLTTFSPQGGVVASGLPYMPVTFFGPTLVTAGHGTWKTVGARAFQIHFVSLLQGAPDNPTAQGMELGTDTLSLSVELDPEGTALSGSFTDVVKDLAGNVVFTTEGTYTATRISIEP